jgi:hypothetical protein
MVARLTPDQKVACSIHVRFNFLFENIFHTSDLTRRECVCVFFPFLIDSA